MADLGVKSCFRFGRLFHVKQFSMLFALKTYGDGIQTYLLRPMFHVKHLVKILAVFLKADEIEVCLAVRKKASRGPGA